MNPDITPELPTGGTRRIKTFALRLPRGLADQIEQRSKLSGESMNQHIVDAVRIYLGEGGPATAERIEKLEEDVTRTVTLFAAVCEEIKDMKLTVDHLERLAQQSGAEF